MKLKIIYSIIFFSIFSLKTFAVSLEEVRKNYSSLVSNEELCEKFMKDLNSKKNSSAVFLAYLGGVQAIWANHVFNPLSKLNTFNEGKSNIEAAIRKDPYNIEIRFIRYSIQKSAPGILDYKSNLKEDKEYLKNNLSLVNSAYLKKNIESILKL